MLNHPRVLVVGAGTGGLAAAIELAQRDERVLVVEASSRVGGALHVSWAQMSAAGTSLQAARGIDDSPDEHYDDVMRISHYTADARLVRRAVEEAPNTLEWLLERGFDVHQDCPALHYFHEPYSKPRTYWGRRAGRSVLDVLERERATHWSDRQDLQLRTRLLGLHRDGCHVDRVTVGTEDGRRYELTPEVVLLATGGYAANAELFPRLTEGYEVISPAAETSDGSGLIAALGIGADLRGSELFLPTFGGVEDPKSPGRSVPLDDFPQLTPQERLPWEVYVDARGWRFIAEDGLSVDVKEQALLSLPGMRFWVIYDERIRRDAPPLLPTWSSERIDEAWAIDDGFVRADSLEELAIQAGIDPTGLADTVATYNEVACGSVPDPFHRNHVPAPIMEPPFYAVRNRAVALKSPAGLRVDAQLRVQDVEGKSFDNLYAIGEALGGSALSGRSFVGGMSVTPAISFGRQLGRTL